MAPQKKGDIKPHTTVQKWFVAFTSYRGRTPLYRRFLRRGFGHVFAFTKLEGTVLMLDPQQGGVFITTIPEVTPESRKAGGQNLSVFITGLKAALPEVTILQVLAKRPSTRKHLSMFLPSCVTAIKSILCRQNWALTPFQLYKSLLKAGALPVQGQNLEVLKEADITNRQQSLN